VSNTNQIRPDRASHLEPLADLMARVDLPELVAESAGPGRQHGETVTYSGPSPTHNDSTPSFVVRWHNGRQRYKCFGCTAGGDALDYVQ
jgi:DNA primase